MGEPKLIRLNSWDVKRKLATVFDISNKILLWFTFIRTQISDAELDEITRQAMTELPRFGERMLMGYIVSQGLKIQRRRIRASIKRVDPVGLIERRQLLARRITRRAYSVPHPHYMWHIDGNHKLIRWGFVIHAAVDGHSRCMLFLRCNNNNRSETVLQLFQGAMALFQTEPKKIRTDCGTENVGVWEAMTEQNQTANGPVVLVGSSVHNQRVERFNREINRNIRDKYAAIFYQLEHRGLLNVDNVYDKLALHYVYKPRINIALTALANSHNNHPIRTEANHTPNQILALNGFHTPTLVSHDDTRQLFEDDILSAEYCEHLMANVPPFTKDDDHGCTVYEAVREFIHLYADT